MRALITLLATLWLVAGCNTIAGMGKDIASAGSSIENAANSNKKKQ